jgi:hypothetical protein
MKNHDMKQQETNDNIGKLVFVSYLICEAAPPDYIAKACKSWTTEITLAN